LYSVKWRTLAQFLRNEMRLDAYAHVQNLEMSYFEDKSSGGLLSIINDDVNQLERFLDGGASSLIQLVTSTLAVGVIFFYLAPVIAVFALLPIPIVLLAAYGFQTKLGPRYMKVREKAGLLSARLANNFGGIATIKSYTSEQYEVGRLREDSRAYQDANYTAIKMSSAFIPLVRMAIVLGFIMTLVLGGWMSIHGTLAVGSYSVLVFLTQRLLWPFTRLAEMTDLYQRAMASAKRVLDLLDTPIGIPVGGKALNNSSVRGELQFANVSFVYPNGAKVLHDLNLNILPGKTTAIVGATGSGKSTVMKLILRFYEPSTGTILLDGENINLFSLKDIRQSMAFVSQDVFLFHGTVLENIAYGSFDASMDGIIKAARAAEAHDFIMQLPQGYETVVGERGQKLSGGQRQRLSIARAVLKDAPIFILDEATSSVDNETEEAIQRSIDRIAARHTMIVIAHRLSTIRNADQIIVMDKGRIVEKGLHEELIAKNGIYAKLWRIQTGEG
ncbi:MAG: ABC transporter ATP-binding protein, partial [bacterium]|nr:ABC transporter ATP-binding protein [bacterium]